MKSLNLGIQVKVYIMSFRFSGFVYNLPNFIVIFF